MRNEQIKSPFLRDLVNSFLEVSERNLKKEAKEKENQDKEKEKS